MLTVLKFEVLKEDIIVKLENKDLRNLKKDKRK